MRRLIVPGNLLLAGEYAVTEPGGKGIAVAIARYVSGTVTQDSRFSVVGIYGYGPPSIFDPSGNDPSTDDPSGSLRNGRLPAEGLIPRMVDFLSTHCGIRIDSLSGRLTIDSTAFYDASGRKLGYGSSAAAAVCLCAGIAFMSGYDESGAVDFARENAVHAHRYAQGGKGSGYDVTASINGGIGIFTGGDTPGWDRIDLPWLAEVALVNNAQPVRSGGAVTRYEHWKREHPAEYAAFRDASDECARRLSTANTLGDAIVVVEEARRLGIRLGEAIGVPADFDAIETRGDDDEIFEHGVAKAIGAGNELIWWLPARPGVCDIPGIRIEHIDTTGARWE